MASDLETALAYVQRFAEGDIDGLGALLADDFRLRGPLLQVSSKQAYLDSLRDGGLDPAERTLLGTSGESMHVAVFYEYRKPAVTLTIGQHFTFRDGLIVETLLTFDASSFA